MDKTLVFGLPKNSKVVSIVRTDTCISKVVSIVRTDTCTNATYSYDTAGDLFTVSYNDGSTPSATYTYDWLGRISSVVRGGTAASFVYDLANDVLSETYTGGTLNGFMVTNQYDADLRRTQMTLCSNSVPLCRAIYGYDAASRLASVSDGTNSATYSYLANSPMVGQIVFASNGVTRMTTSRQYDYLNRLSAISSSPSNSFAYLYNAANQRTMDRLADGSYWRYGYDALGQVTAGNKFWVDETPVAGQQFDYAFDTIGNRTQTQAGGDQNGLNLRVAGYTNNTLNQITSRGVPGYVDVMGDALATNSVTVNGAAAYRKNEFFRDQLSVANTANPVWQSVTNASPGQTTVTGHLYLAKNPETNMYDADGNLLSDGRWSYAWDGENRLIGMTSLSSAPSGSQLQLAFAYDYQGRRIQKTVSTNNGSAYVGEYTNNYAYDGWNLIATLNSSLAILNSYLWGSDLSGSIQGAGGVGGLLAENIAGNGVQFVAYDGNGNVSALVNAANGATVANYEYGPFGEVIRATGPMAKLNPAREGTKFYDDETDMAYYGYRYYNPSTGRWLSRDPAEENGGLNLYGFVNNDAVDYCDMLGLEWIVARNHGARAKVIATSPSDTIGQLASKIGLNPLEYKKWLEPADDPVVSCNVYTIPNQIVLAVGKIKNTTNPLGKNPLRIAEDMAQYAEITLDLKGFQVLYYDYTHEWYVLPLRTGFTGSFFQFQSGQLEG
jgi:RHS repeat-associated protein